MNLKLHLLAIAAHPDDIELSCAGTLIKHVNAGQSVGILDLTQGELGTRGSAELRLLEAQAAAKVMGVEVRENAGMADGFFRNDEEHQRTLIQLFVRLQLCKEGINEPLTLLLGMRGHAPCNSNKCKK